MGGGGTRGESEADDKEGKMKVIAESWQKSSKLY